MQGKVGGTNEPCIIVF